RILLARQLLQLRQELPHLCGAKAGADASHGYQSAVAVHAGDERAEIVAFRRPATDYHLMAGSALGFCPASRPPRVVRRIEAFRYHSLEGKPARRLEDRRARAGEVLEIPQPRAACRRQGFQQALELLFAFRERQRPQVASLEKHDVEREQDQRRLAPLRERGLQGGKIRDAPLIERHRLAVDQTIRQRLRRAGDRSESLRPVEALARQQYGAPALHPQLQSITVELDLVRPAFFFRRPRYEATERRLEKFRHGSADPLGVGGATRVPTDASPHLAAGMRTTTGLGHVSRAVALALRLCGFRRWRPTGIGSHSCLHPGRDTA